MIAANVCLAAGIHADVSYRHYQSVKFTFISGATGDRLEIDPDAVRVYVDALERQRIAAESTPAE